jgi:uncharacterized protein (UPF0332 family)
LTDEQRELLVQSRDSVDAAKLLLDAGYAGFSASRSYYAMFYVAEALLLSLDLSFSKHSAVIAAFGSHFSKTGLVPREYQRYLTEAESLRHIGDYGDRYSVTSEPAQEQIRRAERFLAQAQQMLGSLQPGADMGSE